MNDPVVSGWKVTVNEQLLNAATLVAHPLTLNPVGTVFEEILRDLSCAFVSVTVFVVMLPTACDPKLRFFGNRVTGTNSYAPMSTIAVGRSFPLMIRGLPAKSLLGKSGAELSPASTAEIGRAHV